MQAATSLRRVLRSLARTPFFTLVAVLTLAVGIGAHVAVFTVVDAVLLEPLPFDEPERLVGVWHTAPGLGWDQMNQAPALYFTYREQGEVFEDSGLWDNTRSSVTGQGEPEVVQTIMVTDGTLPLLGAQPLLGRTFSAEDDSPASARTVVLAHSYWQERFGGDTDVLGSSLVVDGEPHEVIGVMRADLHFLDFDPKLYLPLRFDRDEVIFGNFSYQGVARLKEGRTIAQANAELERLIPIAVASYPMPPGFTEAMVEEAGLGPRVQPLADEVVGDVGQVLWLLLATAGLVLLVACANVASLLMVRAESRQQEIAVRQALGAGRKRLAGRVLLEGMVLALAGGVAGVGLAWAGLRVLIAQAPRGLPRLDEIAIDGSVLLDALVVSVASALVFSIFPLVRLRVIDLVGALKEGGRGASDGRQRGRARNLLVAGQIAIALVLLVGSGLMVRSLRALSNVDPGFRAPHEALTLRLGIPSSEAEEGEAVIGLYDRVRASLAEIPGVSGVGMATSITMDGWDSNDPVFVEDFPSPADQIPPLRRFKWIGPDYFEVMGNPLVAGRAFEQADIDQRRGVAMVTRSFASQFWADPSAALGRRIRVTPSDPWREIVGVVGDVRDDGVAEPATDVIYWPAAMAGFWGEELYVPRSMAFVVRSPRVGAASFARDVQEAVWAVNGNLPLANVRTLDEILRRSLARTSFTLVMLSIAALAAVLLGGIGIYGVTSYAVSARQREIGVRMAFGARPRQVARLVLRHGFALALAGLAIGLGAAFGVTRWMSAVLYGVSPLDPLSYALGGLAVVGLVLLASYLPARRAARLDPIETLRAE